MQFNMLFLLNYIILYPNNLILDGHFHYVKKIEKNKKFFQSMNIEYFLIFGILFIIS